MLLSADPGSYAPLVAAVSGVFVLFVGKAGASAVGAISRWLDSINASEEEYSVEIPQLDELKKKPR